ncbi:8139_t:CDS:2, partial [Gigaspora rosea]
YEEHRGFERKMLIVSFGIPEDPSLSTSKTQEKPAYTDHYCLKNYYLKPDMKSDIYRFAITIHVFRGGREIPVEGTPIHYENIYKSCWDGNPEKRPSIVSVLEKLKQLQLTFQEEEK